MSLATTPKRWPTEWAFWDNCYLEIMFLKLQAQPPPPGPPQSLIELALQNTKVHNVFLQMPQTRPRMPRYWERLTNSPVVIVFTPKQCIFLYLQINKQLMIIPLLDISFCKRNACCGSNVSLFIKNMVYTLSMPKRLQKMLKFGLSGSDSPWSSG